MARLQESLLFIVLIGLGYCQLMSDCDPLVPQNCILPFPNNFYLRKDASTPSGNRLHLGLKTLPVDISGKGMDPTNWNMLDGFSTLSAISTYFPNLQLDTAIAAPHWNISLSLAQSSPTLLLNADTGEIVAHWVEIDRSSGPTADSTLLLWPAGKLKYGTRYIVAMRSLRDTSGLPVQVSSAFTAFRDKIPTSDPDVELRRATFEDIFVRLAKAGWSRSQLQIAWDFTTASRQATTQGLVHMRDDGLARLDREGYSYTILEVDNNYSPQVAKRIVGLYKIPLYLESELPGAYLVIDPTTGLPVFQGWGEAVFELTIPTSVTNGTFSSPAPNVVYGHGLFGSHEELQYGTYQRIQAKYGWNFIGTDMWGLSEIDVPFVADMFLQDMSPFRTIPDRCSQGVLNTLVLTRLLRKLATDPLTQFNGKPAIDPNTVYYNGNSQGGIGGNIVMALTQDIERGVLGVPGASYDILLPRSKDFVILFDILKARYWSPMDRINMLTVVQQLWERGGPAGYMDAIIDNTLPNTPKHSVIAQYGLGDCQVTWLGALAMSRSIGCNMYQGNLQVGNETLYGFPMLSPTQTLTSGCVVQAYAFKNAPLNPMSNIPPSDPQKGDTHPKVREDVRSQAMMAEFFRTGVIRNYCSADGCQPIS